jgi:hypothetical protein
MSHLVHQRPTKRNLGRTEESQVATAIVPKETSSLLAVNVILPKETLLLERETAKPLSGAETQMRCLQTKTAQTTEPEFLSQFLVHAASSDSG